MKLFFISADEDNGDNWDLFVWAHTDVEAMKLWAQHYGFTDKQQKDAITAVFRVPTTAPEQPQALPWHVGILKAEFHA